MDLASALCATSACTLVISLSPSSLLAYSLLGNRSSQRVVGAPYHSQIDFIGTQSRRPIVTEHR